MDLEKQVQEQVTEQAPKKVEGKQKLVKTDNYIKGSSNAVPFIGKELEKKLADGEVIELATSQTKILKQFGWVEIYKGEK